MYSAHGGAATGSTHSSHHLESPTKKWLSSNSASLYSLLTRESLIAIRSPLLLHSNNSLPLKCILWSHIPLFGSQSETFFFLSSRVRGDRARAFWFRPRIRAAVTYSCQEHFSDPKRPIGKWSNFNPPFWEFSRKAGHARSRPYIRGIRQQQQRLTTLCISS